MVNVNKYFTCRSYVPKKAQIIICRLHKRHRYHNESDTGYENFFF